MPYTSRIPSPSSSMDHHAGAKGMPDQSTGMECHKTLNIKPKNIILLQKQNK